MVDKDKQIKANKYNAFMGTIAICVLYAIIAFIFLVYISYTDSGKAFYTSLRPFAITFVFGTLIIIILTTWSMSQWNPEEAQTKKTPGMDILKEHSCPDYYKMEKNTLSTQMANANQNVKPYDSADQSKTSYYIGTDPLATSELDKFDKNNHVDYDKFKIHSNNDDLIENVCRIDPQVYSQTGYEKHFGTVANGVVDFNRANTKDGKSFDSYNSNTTFRNDQVQDKRKMLAAFTAMNSKSGNTPTIDGTFKCDEVYPSYLASLDAKEYLDNDETGPMNKFRCEFAKQCKVPWTEAGCE